MWLPVLQPFSIGLDTCTSYTRQMQPFVRPIHSMPSLRRSPPPADGEITEGRPDRVLRSKLGMLVVAEHRLNDVRHDDDRIRFIDVSRLAES